MVRLTVRDTAHLSREGKMATALLKTDFEHANEVTAGYFFNLEKAIATALADERERCARIAEEFNAAGKPIAAAIRRT